MKIIETGPREIGFVYWGHCQNLLDDPRMSVKLLLCVCCVCVCVGGGAKSILPYSLQESLA